MNTLQENGSENRMARLKLFGLGQNFEDVGFSQCTSFTAEAVLDLSDDSAPHSIYQVPTFQGRHGPTQQKAAITALVVRGFSGLPSSAQVSFGWNPDCDDVSTSINLAGTDLANVGSLLAHMHIPGAEITPTLLDVLCRTATVGAVLRAKITTPEESSLTCLVTAFGYLF